MSTKTLMRQTPLLTLTVIVLALMGLGLTAGGIWLITLGGSLYYLIAGLSLLATAWLLFGRRAEALWLYAALLLGTMTRAIWEVGFDFWSPAPRGDVLVPLGVWLLLPLITSHLMANRRAAGMALATVSSLAIVVLGIP